MELFLSMAFQQVQKICKRLRYVNDKEATQTQEHKTITKEHTLVTLSGNEFVQTSVFSGFHIG